ncbi:TlpA disulfide reductase family protein [Ruficoccus sp. ZRK36]|uniref:TlpA family protein disulfide reductase n=1 Tax=Ruficoccus sp. ZRK36 TaxID=2866311 RepID=UPI001C738A80|nr:TlpA disulfide reductase family protein [Ruficoccus sp. ZRK36]QYY36788.1 TlpA family protein disulfide reductase [Ruficoccus sp. ZRK36]
MKSLTRILSGAAVALCLIAQPAFAQESAPAAPQQDPRVEIIQQQLQQLKAQGASDMELTILETMAYYQFGMNEQADAKIADVKKAIPEIEKTDGPNSENARAARAIVLMGDARKSWDKGDMDAASALIGQAFVQVPEVAQAIAGEWVNTYWQDKVMADVTIPMDKPLAIAAGGETTLGDLVKGNKAVYIDFWASWCGPCMQAMPELKARAAEYSAKGIVFAGVNLEDAASAEKVAKDLDISSTPLKWLLETEAFPLSDLLNITSIPHVALISPEGKVLWLGHPADPALMQAVAKLADS